MNEEFTRTGRGFTTVPWQPYYDKPHTKWTIFDNRAVPITNLNDITVIRYASDEEIMFALAIKGYSYKVVEIAIPLIRSGINQWWNDWSNGKYVGSTKFDWKYYVDEAEALT